MRKSLLLLTGLFLSICSWSQEQDIYTDRWNLVKQHLESQEDISGIWIVGNHGEIRINHGAGFADRKNQVTYSDKTLYTVGSITKPFTATAIMLLMEQGRLSPADPITTYFDRVPADKQEITLHQLLTHTSGLPGAIGDDYETISAIDFQKRAWSAPLLFSPGEGYDYSNVGYSLLGMVIEKISGMSYSEFLEEYVFTPTGMITAGYRNPRADYNLLAHGYLTDGTDTGTSHEKNWNGDEPHWHLKANGGILMSATDMFQWYLALRNNKVLQPATLKLQTAPHADEGNGSFYGYGYAVSPQGRSVEHNGSNRIFKADFRWFPGSDMFLFSASNDAKVRLFRLNDEIIRILETGELPETEQWVEIPVEQFPADENQYSALAFIEFIQQYTAGQADAFINEYCTPGIMERNGREKLDRIFHMLHQDAASDPVDAVYVSGEKVKLVLPATGQSARLKITLVFEDHRIDQLSAEMEGM